MVKEINIKDLLRVIEKRFWIIILMIFLSIAAGWIHSKYFTTPLYQTSTKIIIGADPGYMKTLQVIIKDSTVLQKVANQLKLPFSADALAGKIIVDNIDDSQVVRISVVDTNPERAAQIANKTASVFKNEVPNIVNFRDVRILSEANVNPWPINESSNSSLIEAMGIGFVIGLGLVFLMDSLDETINKESEIEEYLGIPILGNVSRMTRRNIMKKNRMRLNIAIKGESYD
ncbi:YveK family protein [Falsibacillus albus]|uniref:Capsular biosynthesis protein n=1 Tax=Falsibacillus albus TaxID=2478915 RepID=A0A3L7JZV1_9BACI|nr:Wzz/FepE/Etk N-terminal domain-containing protein [Falsibacillus albus]RLQ96286.1 capsular biosynthesis protein [Falsibacillus albus]